MKYRFKKLTKDYMRLSLQNFDIYNEAGDRALLKQVFSTLFLEGDQIFFFFMREEDLTEDEELIKLRNSVIPYFQKNGEYYVIDALDDRRFTSIASIRFNSMVPNLMIDSWKLFYTCSFFVPKFDILLEDYSDYLEQYGKMDNDGIKHIENMVTDMICIKGLGGDYINICYSQNSDKISEQISRITKLAKAY